MSLHHSVMLEAEDEYPGNPWAGRLVNLALVLTLFAQLFFIAPRTAAFYKDSGTRPPELTGIVLSAMWIVPGILLLAMAAVAAEFVGGGRYRGLIGVVLVTVNIFFIVGLMAPLRELHRPFDSPKH